MFEHDVQPERKLIIARGSEPGIGTESSASEEAADSLGRLLDDPRVESDFSLMIVVHPGGRTPTEAELSRIAGVLRLVRKRIRGRIAVVVPGVGHATLAQMISIMSDSTSEVFQDEDEATRWILEDASAR